MIDKRAVLLSKDESAYNTDSTPVANTDAILIEDLKWGFANQRMFQQKPLRASLGMLKSLYAGALISISGKCAIKGSGAAGTAPEIGPLLRGAGLKETIVASTSVTYAPSSTQSDHKSQTQYFYDDGLLLKCTGMRGKVSLDLQVGQVAYAAFDFTGHFVSITDVALPSATFDSTVPPVLVNVPFSADSYSAVIQKLAVDLGNEVSLPESIAATDGYGEVTITGRNPNGSFNPMRVTKATYDFIAKWQAGAAFSVTTGLIGATGGNKFTLTMPAVTYSDVGRGNQNNIGTYEMKYEARESSGDDEISLAFT